MQKKNYNSA